MLERFFYTSTLSINSTKTIALNLRFNDTNGHIIATSDVTYYGINREPNENRRVVRRRTNIDTASDDIPLTKYTTMLLSTVDTRVVGEHEAPDL